MILQAVKIDMHGRSNTAERQLLLKRNRLRIDADSDNQYTATIVDLDAYTITQLDLIKKSGIVYSISTLRDIVNNKLLDLLTNMLGKPATVPHR